MARGWIAWDRIQTFYALRENEFYPAAKTGESVHVCRDSTVNKALAERIGEMVAVLGHE